MASSQNDFFQRVYAVAALIPEGKVTSYGAIARFLGAARSARMVGYAMNASINNDRIPAHRVLNRNGLLTGKAHFPGTDLMQELLENEGLVVKHDQVIDFKEHFWDPSSHLDPTNF